MHLWQKIKSRWPWSRQQTREADLDRELRTHIELETEEQAEAGLSTEEAHYAARRALGNTTQIKEDVRAMWGFLWLETLLQDLRYGLRQLRRNPGFTAVAVITLALGIGANTAIFSVINAVMLNVLPVSHPNQLVLLRWESPHMVTDYFPYPTFDQLREHNSVFSEMFAFHELQLATRLGDQSGLAEGSLVSSNYFSALGIKAAAGRTFTAEADRTPGGAPFAVISYRYWKRQFGLDPAAIGKLIKLNGAPFTIIGVTTPGFFGVTVGDSRDIWIPITMQAQVMDGRSLLNDTKSWWLRMMARRKAGISESKALAGINVAYQEIARRQAGARLASESDQELAHEKIALVPASKGLSGLRSRFSAPLLILMALVGVLLLIACANIASLALARATARQKEMAVRAALGAGRMRLMRQLFTESLLLAAFGGIAGFLLADWGDNLLLKLLSGAGTPAALNLYPDAKVFAFVACIAVATAILSGIAPAWKAAHVSLNAALKASARTVAGGSGNKRSRLGLRKLMVASEVAMSLLLLVSAGMLVRSLEKLKEVNPGFDENNVLLVSVDPTLIGYRGTRLMNLYGQLADNIEAVPGVRSASLAALPPMSGAQWRTGVFVQGRVPGPHENTTALMNLIGPSFFKTMGIALLRGRDFTLRDNADAPEVAITNKAMARFYFGDESPIGKRLSFRGPGRGELEIVGVAQDTKYNGLRAPPPRVIYLPYLQTPAASLPFGMTLEIRTAGNPESYAGAIRQAIRGVSRELPILGFTTVAEQVNRSLGEERLVAELSSFFGLLALILASVGLYGVMTYAVTQRTGEIGIRMALGAQRSDVLWMVLREALQLVALGAGLGVPIALVFTRIISSQFYGITPYDPVAVCVATAVLAAIAAIASYIPARRATKVDPMVALRHE
ncbi:MAG: ADOP family duplicated permease [Terriglobia bacterium]